MQDIKRSRRRTLVAASLAAGGVCFALFSLVQPATAATLPPAPYTLGPGRTLQTAAVASGLGVADVRRVNGVPPDATPRAGVRLALPFLYKVQSGDQIAYLANQYQTTVASICALNRLRPLSRLWEGQVLLIARGSKTASAAAAIGAPRAHRTVRRPLPSRALAAPGETIGRMTATAYDAGPSSNGGYGAVNYFGQPLRFGDVAVDPSVIPLGSRLFISGYSDPALPRGGFYATANDVGGAIRGRRIDIFMPGGRVAADAFGIESVRVRVISRG